MAKHNNKLFFWLSLIFGFVMGVVMILFFGSGSAHAQTNQRVTLLILVPFMQVYKTALLTR